MMMKTKPNNNHSKLWLVIGVVISLKVFCTFNFIIFQCEMPVFFVDRPTKTSEIADDHLRSTPQQQQQQRQQQRQQHPPRNPSEPITAIKKAKNNTHHHQSSQTESRKTTKKKKKKIVILYSGTRQDRTGAAITDMLMCHAYVYKKQRKQLLKQQRKQQKAKESNTTTTSSATESTAYVYGGACGESPYLSDFKRMITSLGLQDVLPFRCPSSSSSSSLTIAQATLAAENDEDVVFEEKMVDKKSYMSHDNEKFTPEWIGYIQQQLVRHRNGTKTNKSINSKRQQSLFSPTSSSSSSSNSLQILDTKNDWDQTNVTDTSITSTEDNGDYYYTIAVHIRRGDVNPCCSTRRYSPNSHYLTLIERYIHQYKTSQAYKHARRHLRVIVYSESISFEPWDDFQTNLTRILREKQHTGHHDEDDDNNDGGGGDDDDISFDLLLDHDPVDIWHTLIFQANVVIMSKSTFSFLPSILNIHQEIPTKYKARLESSLLSDSTTTTTTTTTNRSSKNNNLNNNNHIVFTPGGFYHDPMPYWDIIETSLQEQADEEMYNMKEANCLSREIECSKEKRKQAKRSNWTTWDEATP